MAQTSSLWLFVTKTIAEDTSCTATDWVRAKFVLIALLLVSVGASSCRKHNPADERRFDLKGQSGRGRTRQASRYDLA